MRYARDGWAIESGQYQRSTGRLPDWFLREPPTVRGDEVYLKAYARLSTERKNWGRQVGPIPWMAVDTYARRYGFGPLMAEFFVDVLMLLDQEYREHVEEDERKQASRENRRALKHRKAEQDAIPARRRR